MPPSGRQTPQKSGRITQKEQKGGVKKAVDEFIREHSVELLAIRNKQFALRR